MDDEKIIPAAGSEPSEPVSSIDKAMDYVSEHPLFSEEAAAEPTPAAEPKPGEAGAPPAAEPKPGEAKAPEGKPGEPAAPAAAAITGPAKVGDEIKYKIGAEPVKTLDEIKQLPYFNDATFQKIFSEHAELSAVTNGLREITSAGRYTISDTDTLKATLEDAFALYDIGYLKMPVSEFLGKMKENFPEENWKAIVAQLAKYAEENGIKAGDAAAFQDSNYLAIKRLERERADDKRKEAERNSADSQAKTFTALESRVKEFCKTNEVPEADALDYITVVVAQIGGKKDQLTAIQSGKWGEVDRILTEYNNRWVERANAWMQARLDKKGQREKKLPSGKPADAGGAPPAPPARKVNLADGEERRAEAYRQFTQKT